MNAFRAAVLREHYSPLSIETFEKQLPGPGQVLVKMITSGLCGAQINEIDAVKGEDKYLPHFMGHEGYGYVLAIGEGVTKVKQDDHVVLHWRKGSGCDCFGGKYNSSTGTVGSGPVTTFAEQTIVSENRVTLVNKNYKLKNLFPLIGCALSTSYGIVKNLEKNSKVIIAGAGGLGLAIAFWLKVLGNFSYILIDKDKTKEELSTLFGAKFTTSNNISNLEKANYSIDTTGNVEVISKLFNLLSNNGSLILVGQPRLGEKLVLENPLEFFSGKRIFSSDGGDFNPDTDLATIVSYISKNKKLADKLVTDTIFLDQINDGFDKLRAGKSGRIIINFEENK